MVHPKQPLAVLGKVYFCSFTSYNLSQLRSCVDALAASTGRAVPPLLTSVTRLHPPTPLSPLQSRTQTYMLHRSVHRLGCCQRMSPHTRTSRFFRPPTGCTYPFHSVITGSG